MSKQFKLPAAPRRGIVAVRADAGGMQSILDNLNAAFDQFKQANDDRLKGIEAKFDDVVQREKVDRINDEVSALNKALTDANAAIAAMRLGGGGGEDPDAPAKREHAQAFERFFRKGVDAGLSDLEVKARLTTQSDPDGGYLVPEEMAGTIDRVLGTVSVMRQLANVMPIGTDTYKKLVSMGGAGGGWVGEEEARPETATPGLRELVFTVMEMYANPATTQRMLDDGIVDIEAWLADEVMTTFAELEGNAFLNGTGVKQPRGLMTYDKVANGSYTWGKVGFIATGAASTFKADPDAADAFINLYGALKQGYRSSASWLMSDATMTTVRKFKDGNDAYIWAPPSGTAEVPTILGKPVYTDDYMPGLGANTFPVAFGDFRRAYMILDRIGIRVLRDPFTSKPNVLFYTTKRVGGGLSNFEAVKFMKCST